MLEVLMLQAPLAAKRAVRGHLYLFTSRSSHVGVCHILLQVHRGSRWKPYTGKHGMSCHASHKRLVSETLTYKSSRVISEQKHQDTNIIWKNSWPLSLDKLDCRPKCQGFEFGATT